LDGAPDRVSAPDHLLYREQQEVDQIIFLPAGHMYVLQVIDHVLASTQVLQNAIDDQVLCNNGMYVIMFIHLESLHGK